MSGNYQIGARVFDNWIIKKKIGEGSFGQVFEIQREDFGQIYRAALKLITVPQSEAELRAAMEEGMMFAQAEQYFYSVVEDIVREFAIMSRLKGTANVVSYEDHTVIRHPDGIGWDVLIRMELLNPLLPYAYEHPFARRDIIRLGIDICKALELCQKYNVIHRDIKPENIFVSDNGDFKLGDFGIARTIEKTMSGLSKKGTYNYMAPEVYRGAEYGFGVDIYSLGLVLYRLLNKNRVPFLPPVPEPITYSKREQALAKRMAGEKLPLPYYAEGRLAEIVLKACAFDPKDRYSSPVQMRQELEAILYAEEDASLIYPDGDELSIAENQYASHTAAIYQSAGDVSGASKTQSIFAAAIPADMDFDTSRTEGLFSPRPQVQSQELQTQDSPDKTENVLMEKTPAREKATPGKRKPKNLKLPWMIAGAVGAVCVVLGIVLFLQHRQKLAADKLATYQQLMLDGTNACESDPNRAEALFLEAQALFPEEPAPYISYAYALYCGQEYEACIRYVEDDLALGKNYEIVSQSQLSEILGAAYFELDDYAAAASFFRLSTAGGDITVPAMRDYAVSLGRLGDVQAADDVLQRMFDAGADGEVTAYVQAEVDFALKDYLSAEAGFQSVLNSADDIVLQKRALRSLAEVYRDCSGLARVNASPISRPATKEAELLADGIERYGLRYDSTIWEMLALAYFEAYHTDTSVSINYLTKAADCFNRVIALGVQKDYLYSNLYTIYYELEHFEDAEQALRDYESAFPHAYMPHALRGMMLITIENQKSQDVRDYSAAKREYEIAGSMIRGSDDATYYQQLESLILQLEESGWIDSEASPAEPASELVYFTDFTGNMSGFRTVPFSAAYATSEMYHAGILYDAKSVIDGDLGTSWQEDVAGDGIGEHIILYFDGTQEIELLCLYLGYIPYYEWNGRPSELEFEFSDGTVLRHSFVDENRPFYIKLSYPVCTNYVKITILGAYTGSRWDDTCITEVIAYCK